MVTQPLIPPATANRIVPALNAGVPPIPTPADDIATSPDVDRLSGAINVFIALAGDDPNKILPILIRQDGSIDGDAFAHYAQAHHDVVNKALADTDKYGSLTPDQKNALSGLFESLGYYDSKAVEASAEQARQAAIDAHKSQEQAEADARAAREAALQRSGKNFLENNPHPDLKQMVLGFITEFIKAFFGDSVVASTGLDQFTPSSGSEHTSGGAPFVPGPYVGHGGGSHGPGIAISQAAMDAWKANQAQYIAAHGGQNPPVGMFGSAIGVNSTISSGFGARVPPKTPLGPGSGWHLGVDQAAPLGSEVKAIADGTILFSGRAAGYGNLVVVGTDDGRLSYRLGHVLDDGMPVVGTRVHKGQTIAYVGNEGRSTGPHLHLEVRQGVSGAPLQPTYMGSALVKKEVVPGAASFAFADAGHDNKTPDTAGVQARGGRGATHAAG